MKKLSVILLSGFLLAACGESKEDTEEDEQPTDTTEEIEEKEEENEGLAGAEGAEDDDKSTSDLEEDEFDDEANEMEKTDDLKTLSEYMAKDSFVNKFGVEALENYVEIDEQLTYMEFDAQGEILNPNGSSMDEVIEAIDSVIEDAVYETVEDEEQDITTITFYYMDPDEPEQEDEDAEVMNYGDVSFAFQDDNLYISNIAPGWFEVRLDSLAEAEELETIDSIKDLPEIDPDLQIFTLGKMNLHGQPFIQAMTPTTIEDEDGEENIIAHYLYFVDDENIFANYIYFQETAENFPIHGIQAMYGYFDEMAE